MNLANKLTIIRVVLVPILVIISLIPIQGELLGIPYSYWIMNVIFVVASITDKIDGYIARSRNQVTNFGKFLDPLADKILVLAAMLILVEDGNLPAWIPIIVLTREFLVSGYRLIAVEKGGKVIAASIWGKLKTATQMFAIGFMFVNIQGTNSFANFLHSDLELIPLIINIITTVLMTVSVIATIFSGWNYLKGGKEFFKDK